MIRRLVVRRAEAYRAHCHEQRRRWREDPADPGMVDLWLGRAEAMSAFIDWVSE